MKINLLYDAATFEILLYISQWHEWLYEYSNKTYPLMHHFHNTNLNSGLRSPIGALVLPVSQSSWYLSILLSRLPSFRALFSQVQYILEVRISEWWTSRTSETLPTRCTGPRPTPGRRRKGQWCVRECSWELDLGYWRSSQLKFLTWWNVRNSTYQACK